MAFAPVAAGFADREVPGCRVTGARPAQAASPLPVAMRVPSPVSARIQAPARGPVPGKVVART
jgi:hypothetical protein